MKGMGKRVYQSRGETQNVAIDIVQKLDIIIAKNVSSYNRINKGNHKAIV